MTTATRPPTAWPALLGSMLKEERTRNLVVFRVLLARPTVIRTPARHAQPVALVDTLFLATRETAMAVLPAGFRLQPAARTWTPAKPARMVNMQALVPLLARSAPLAVLIWTSMRRHHAAFALWVHMPAVEQLSAIAASQAKSTATKTREHRVLRACLANTGLVAPVQTSVHASSVLPDV